MRRKESEAKAKEGHFSSSLAGGVQGGQGKVPICLRQYSSMALEHPCWSINELPSTMLLRAGLQML